MLLFPPLKELWVEIEFTTGTRWIHVGALPPSPRTFGKMAGGDAEHFLVKAISQMLSLGRKSPPHITGRSDQVHAPWNKLGRC